MTRLGRIALVFAAALLLCGMGELGLGPEGKVPETDEDVAARVIDRSGVTTDLTQFSMDGRVYLAGRRGDGEVTVFFRDLRVAAFGEVRGETIDAELQLKSGETLRLQVQKRTVFYGSTGYGAYHITARDIARIEFPQGGS